MWYPFTTAEAAAILSVTPRRVRALIASGQLPARKAGRDWRISATAVQALAAQERKAGRRAKKIGGA